MKRTLIHYVNTGLLAVGFCLATVAVSAAPAPGTPLPAPKGKEQYSSRPKNYTPPSMFDNDVSMEPIVTDVATPMMPVPAPVLRRAPEPPKIPKVLETTTLEAPALNTPALNTPMKAAQPFKTEPIVINENSEARPISSVEVEGPKKPAPVAVSAEKPKDTVPTEPPKNDDAAVLNFTAKPQKTRTETTTEPKNVEKAEPVMVFDKNVWERKTAEAAPKHEVLYVKGEPTASDPDDFHARLAKIQLEKHNLAETLELIEKIKSPNFKVKTLVDLAEYVSRDVNYKREADALYTLAIAGIDALAENKPVLVKMPESATKPQPKPVVTAPVVLPRRTAPTLIEEKAPEKAAVETKPAPAPVKPEVVKPEPEKKPEWKLETPLTPVPSQVVEAKPEPVVEPKKETTPTLAPAITPPGSKPTTARMPILLDEEPADTATKPAPPKKEVPKEGPVDPLAGLSSLTLPSKPETKPEPKAEVKPEAEEKPATAPSKRPSLLLTEPAKEETPKTEAPKTDVKKPESVAAPATEATPAAAPKSTKRPMPGKRTLTLETN